MRTPIRYPRTFVNPTGMWHLASQFFYDMSASEAQPNLVTYSAVISAFAAQGQWQAALSPFLDHMRRAQLLPSEIIFSTGMLAACRAVEWTRALQMLSAASIAGLELTTISFNTGISACDEAGRWKDALCLLYNMETAQVSEISFNAAISACNFLRSGPKLRGRQRECLCKPPHPFAL